MIHALTAEAMRRAEAAAGERGVTVGELMERAGRALAEQAKAMAPSGRIVVVTGKGANGGDGWVAARLLHESGGDVSVVAAVSPFEIQGEAAVAAERALQAGIGWVRPDTADGFAEALADAEVVVDAVFGIGFSGPPREPLSWAIDAIALSGSKVLAADMPSGVDADTGQVPGSAVTADVTLTFTAPKPGQLIYPGATHAGEIVVADVGVPVEAVPDGGALEVWDRGEYRALLPLAPRDAHKNQRGRVLIVAGSRAFTGAAVLAVAGAQCMGAGYVTLAVPDSIVPTMQAKLTSAVVVGLPENPSRTLASKVLGAVLDIARDHDAAVIGPGLTLAHGTVLLVRKLVRDLALPMVLDADGLNAMVDAVEMLRARLYPTIATPHPGELGRLLGVESAEVQADRVSFAAKLSGPALTCVLKGARTIISGEGRRVITLTGNPGMATAGAGDVLAGMTGTLLAQGLPPLEAAALAAYLHGDAGDKAAESMSETCMTAEDIAAFMPEAVKALTA
ncbi:MAG: bifunctional ADP-dependent NAD(P)H-hydrate dehydratase/NAD(P)H-hydrate epimerase [Coriobacteriaceae bacterium]|nr:bifunctional ADP-dependent NAD(P)H-hydrate dehydratase/NAD(P)H-hydrate epimerase [Coriobacteriaceae bacterium]